MSIFCNNWNKINFCKARFQRHLLSYCCIVWSEASRRKKMQLTPMKKLVVGGIACLLLAGIAVAVYFVFLKSSTTDKDSLVAVTVLYRHGDRTPVSFYANDPFKDPSHWSVPPGELTNEGKMRHFKFGEWMRCNYDGFLSPRYNKTEFYISSSDKSRCLMSAASNLAGLFPPQGNDVWEDELPWQPIPIHSTPSEYDDVSEVQHSCAKFQPLLDRLEKEEPIFMKMNTENKDLFKYLTEHSGTNVTEIVQASYIYDTLHIEEMNYFTLPSWALKVYDKLKNINLVIPEMFTYNQTVARLFIGRFYHKVLSQFNHFGNPNSTVLEDGITQKFRIYSGHEKEVYSSLYALKFPMQEAVPFGAATIFELWKTNEGKFYVQMFYKTDDVELLQIADCDEKCDLDKFQEILKPIIITEDEYWKECS